MGFTVDIATLEVLAEHHHILNRFCVDPQEVTKEERAAYEDSSTASLSLSFEQYCLALSVLIRYGSVLQQLEFLFHTYAVENERGISRMEIFTLLQDHYEKGDLPAHDRTRSEDPRHFEKLYTWLKKHMSIYDSARSLKYLKFQLGTFVTKVKENNARYREKANASQIEL